MTTQIKLASLIAEAMRFHPAARLINVADYNRAFIQIFERFSLNIHSVWARLNGPHLEFTIKCKTLDSTFRLKDSFVYELSPHYIASMVGLHDEQRRVTYMVRNIGDHLSNNSDWKVKLAFGCEVFVTP